MPMFLRRIKQELMTGAPDWLGADTFHVLFTPCLKITSETDLLQVHVKKYSG